MTSSHQVSRLLALVPYLQHHPDAELAAVASDFGVSPKQVVSDLEVLWYCGLPGGLPGDLIEIDMDAVRAEGRIRLSNADYLPRPMRFTLDEVTSLVVALQAVRELAGDSATGSIDSLLTKLRKLTGEAEPRIAVSMAGGQADIRGVLADAIARRLAVRLTYDGQTRAHTTTPVVEPARLATRDGYAYLDAWSRDRQGWRTFRVDRIAAATVLDEPIEERGDPPRVDGNWLEARPDAVLVTLDLDERARWVAEYYPVRSVTHQHDGVRVELLVADAAWLRSLLLRLGPSVRAVDPPELASSATEAAREALAAYQHARPLR